jgi:DNA polymerase-3 subunit beta
VIGTRSTLPILSNVLIETDGDKLWLTSTDLEVSVRCSVPAEIETAGSTTLPAKKLFSIIRELASSELTMELDEKNSTSLTCGSSFFKIMGLPREDFPALPTLDAGFAYTLDQAVLKDMLAKTAYAASSDETRQFLNGVLLSFKNDKLTAVATDGRRLALIEHEVEIPKDAEADMIVPSKAVNELLHSLGNEGQIKIRAVKNQVTFEFGDQVLFSKLIEGNYPNFRQVIPSQAEFRIQIERETLLAAVRRVALLTSDRSNSIKLTFAKNKVEVSAQTQDIGEAHESIPIKFAGAELNVAFNPEFIVDPLRHLTSDEVYLEFNDELSPGVIKCDTPFLYVLMPMRIG